MVDYRADFTIITQGAVAGLKAYQEELKKGRAEQREMNRVVNDFSQPLEAAAGMARNLSTALGSSRGGLASSIVQAATAGARMGAEFGPQGMIVGSILSLAAAAGQAHQQVVNMANAFNNSLEGTRELSREISHLITNIEGIGDAEAANGIHQIGAEIERLRDQLIELRRRQEGNRIDDLLWGPGEDDLELRREIEETTGLIESLTNQMNDLSEASESAGDEMERLARAVPENTSVYGFLTLDPILNREAAEYDATPRRRRPVTEIEDERETSQALGYGRTDTAGINPEDIEVLYQAGRAAEILYQARRSDAEIHEAEVERLGEEADARSRINEELATQAQRMAEVRAELGLAYEDAHNHADELEATWGASIESLSEAFAAENEAARAAGAQTVDTADMMGAAFESVAQSALENLGNGVSTAFAKSISAAIKGQESFDEVMKKMVAGVLDSLLQESIVQAIKETAMAISDFASYRYDSGAMHLAAAGAWAAVGVAAGAGMAAIGSTSGGGRTAPTPTSTPTPDENESASGQGQTFNIYYSNPSFATEEEQVRALETMMRRAS